MDQRFLFGGTIGYGDLYLTSLFRRFKLFRLDAVIHDAAGAVLAHSNKELGYCFKIGRRLSSCLLGHVTGLLFCLHVKLFLPFIFNSVEFWSSMSCIVLDIEPAEKKVMKLLGVSLDWNVHWYTLASSKKIQSHKTRFLVYKKFAMHRIV